MCASSLKIIAFFTPKFVTELSKICMIKDPEKPVSNPGSGVKKATDPGSGSATPLCTVPVLQYPHTYHTYMHHNTVFTYVAVCKKPTYFFILQIWKQPGLH
jgi:hypothetical protein